MIIGIILFSLLAFGILMLILPSKIVDFLPDWVASFVVISLFIGGAGTFVVGSTYICERTKSGYEQNYDKWDSRQRGLAARIKEWNNGAEDDKLWDEVKKYNSDLKESQYWANSSWTSWFNENACNEFEAFDIPEYQRDKEQ